MKKIDLRLFPDVICRGKRYSIYDEENKVMKKSLDIPLIMAYSELSNNKRVLVNANASYGKSSSLMVFEAVLGLKNIPRLSYECRNLNRELMLSISKRAKRSPDTVYIFDGIDELDAEMKDSFGEMMKELNKTEVKIIVSSRFDPMSENFAEGGYEFLMGYEKITICPFTDEQIDCLISHDIDRSSGYYRLLNTTMFLSLHLELEGNNLIGEVSYTVKKEAEFIKQYFTLLSPEGDPEAVKLGDLVHLGEYVHRQRSNRIIRYTERIPGALRHIFYYRKKRKEDQCELYVLDSIQQKYLNYVHGVYLFNRMLDIFEQLDEGDIIKDLSRLIDIVSTYEVSEAFYYCGQLISLMNEHESSEIKAYLECCDISKPNKRKNLLFIFFGANNDLDDDVKRRLCVNYNIDFSLFSDVAYGERVYTMYDTEKKQIMESYIIPLVRAYSELRNEQRVLLIARASLGKSTSLRMLEETKLAEGILCSFYECRKMNIDTMKKICRNVMRKPDRLIIFDAFDELSEDIKDDFCNMMTVLDKTDARIIVSSRYDPIETGTVFGMEFFNGYEKLFIKPFSDEQIKILVGNSVSKRSGYYKMLHNTMFMSMFREISGTRLAVKNEAEFIREYFLKLYADQEMEGARRGDLLRLGEYLHKQRIDDYDRVSISIPRPLQNIFFYYNKKTEASNGEAYYLDSTHQKYLNYIHGEYIFERLLDITNNCENQQECANALARIINISSTKEVSEALYYAGQLAGTLDQKHRNAVIKVLGLRCDEGIIEKYENLLCIFLGANNGVAEDIDGVFRFYSPVMSDRSRRYDFIHTCDRIRVLRASSILRVDFGIEGFSALEEIEIDNSVFRSEGNCLIDKYVDGLLLGCSNSVIPNGVRFISKHAFSCCDNLHKVVIPPSVETIDSLAFMHCTALEYVEIGKGVTKLSKEAFHNCTGIKTLKFNNPQMAFSSGRYERDAFGTLEGLESAIVPTQGIYYLMNICSGNIGTLSVYQGRNLYTKESLTFQDIEGTNRIKNLYIYKDVENISVEAFHKFRNELESIVVEEGNKVYSSEGNCLINKKEGKNSSVILGCKNSVIPTKDVKRLKSYSFVNCDGLTEFIIPDNITQIGEKAFNQCIRLESIVIGKGVEIIENAAFRGCIRLKNVIVNDINKWSEINLGEDINSSPIYYSRSLQSCEIDDGMLVLKAGISVIGERIFKGCENIKGVHIPSSVRKIGKGAFSECVNIKTVHTDALAPWCERNYKSALSNPVLYGADLYIGRRKATRIVIDSQIEKVSCFSFAGCRCLESVIFNSSQIVVEDKAFAKCNNLKTVRFEQIPKYLDKNAFMDCSFDLILKGTPEAWEKVIGEISGINNISYIQ